MLSKHYRVKVPVFNTLEVDVLANSKEEAEEEALNKLVEEQPKVLWEVDTESGIEIVEVEE